MVSDHGQVRKVEQGGGGINAHLLHLKRCVPLGEWGGGGGEGHTSNFIFKKIENNNTKGH